MPMNENLQPVVQSLMERFELESTEFRGEITLRVPREKIAAVCQVLRDNFSFDRLSGQTATDYWPEMDPRFHIIYQLYSLTAQHAPGLASAYTGPVPKRSYG
jgi:NADH-quinone oxidoreductase subunit C